MRYSRERVSWTHDKCLSWLEKTGPLCPQPQENIARARSTPLLMLAGAVACLATFIPLETNKTQPPVRAAESMPELIADEAAIVVLKRD